ncbi:MAG: rod shape-determining protein RodA [Acidobacteriota bacterium]
MKSTSRAKPIQRPRSEDRGSFAGPSRFDAGLLVATLALAVIGLATVHSASAELATDYLPRQALWVGLGLLLMAVTLALDYHDLVDMSVFFYLAGLALLVIVLFFGEGPGGTRSWLTLGGFRVGQPAEFAKLTTALFLARFLTSVDEEHLTLKQIAVAGLIVGAPMALISLQPDLGSAAMFVPLAAGMLLIAGIRLRYLVVAGLIVLALGTATWHFSMQDYQRQRVITFLAPQSDPLGAGYQVQQSKIAVGSGELTGKGYMQGTQSQLRFLPARHTDFVFAVLAEEWGFVGVLVVLGLYLLYLLSALRVALRARDRGGILLVVGLVSLSGFHVAYNTAMVVGLLPITGIPLPFLSYGGSFTLVNFIATGLILGIDLRRYVNR